jgi:hypothetical protein
MGHPYKKLGGWLLALVVMQIIAVALLTIVFIVSMVALAGVFRWLGISFQFYLIVACAVYIAACIVDLRFTYMVAKRNPRFLRYYDILMIILISVILLEFILIGFDPDSVGNLIGSLIGFLIWRTYFKKSVRVRTYMGSDQYIRMSLFSKNAVPPQPAVPDEASAPYAGQIHDVHDDYMTEPVCPNCGFENRGAGKYCAKCGQRLALVRDARSDSLQ